MKRNTFQTKNQLHLRRYLTFFISLAVLTIVFLSISTFGQTIMLSWLSTPSTTVETLDDFTSLTEEERIEICSGQRTSFVQGNQSMKVSIYDTEENSSVFTTQLEIAKQPYELVNTLSEVSGDVQLVVIRADSISEDDVAVLQTLAEKQAAMLFVGLPDMDSLKNSTLRGLLGIKSVEGEKQWPGVRISGDLLTGKMIENPEYEISGLEVKLSNNNKIYACALPENYLRSSNMSLPPIIWRHIEEKSGGRIYVCNGEFTENEMGYGLIPVILSEINDNYIYPIINAYCVTVSGYPFASNESRELWDKYYSRDKQQIQQDMLSSQLQKYSKTYNVILSCFSPDYEVFRDTNDKNLLFYVDQINAARGMLAKEEDDRLMLDDHSQGTEIETWSSTFSFFDAESGVLKLPICFNSQVENITSEEYRIAGIAGTVGCYVVNLDFDDVLDYSKDINFWTEYCMDQEVMLATQNRDYGWLERVTVKEAFGRILQLQKMDINIQYQKDRVEIKLGNFDTKAWFIFRSSKTGIAIDNGSVEQIGRNCYLVTVTDEEAVITWEVK